MRITGWNIDGFGLFNDAQVSQLPEGLTVVYGPNEAGKSTTLAFIRGVLFGFPTGNTKERKYPPLHGGQHGGRLFLENGEGAWTVERTGSPTSSLTVTLPDGSAGTAEDLARLMAYADKEIFRHVGRDLERHLAYGMEHMRYFLLRQPEKRGQVQAWLSRAEMMMANELHRNVPFNEALILLLDESPKAGVAKLAALRRTQIEDYLDRLEQITITGHREHLIRPLASYLEEPEPAAAR